MELQPRFSGQSAAIVATPTTDPRLQPTPDYGTFGPGSDVAAGQAGPIPQSAGRGNPRFAPIAAAVIGMLAALFAGSISRAGSLWSRLENPFSPQKSAPASAKDVRQIERMRPQRQAEALLELAVGKNDGAVEQISARVDRWQGKLEWSPQIANLTTAALNSNDMRVRESGVEVELAAYGLAKNSASLEYLVGAVNSADHARKIWALWALGLMGNRGIGTDRVMQVLTANLKDRDVDSRRWAVESLALVGTQETIEPLLQTMHDDPSPVVRERAACSLAESGMLTHEQRMSVVPRLLSYTDDPALDAQTHGWAFEALNDITHQHLGNDSATWRNWYNSSKGD